MSAADRIARAMFGFYMVAFFLYLFAPLAIMGIATFNTSRFPTVTPWRWNCWPRLAMARTIR